MGLATNETTFLGGVIAGFSLLLFDIQEGFLLDDFFVGVCVGCGEYVVVLLLMLALRSAISLRIQTSNFDMNEAIDSIPFSPWSFSSSACDCSSV